MSSTIPLELIYALIPIILFQFALQLYALYDWFKQGPDFENRFVWLLVIFLLNILGPLLYFWKAPRETLDI